MVSPTNIPLMFQNPQIFISMLSSFWILLASSLFTSSTNNGTIDLQLIHRDSPLSPLFNPNLTPSERVIFNFKQSIARMQHLQSSNLSPQYLITAPLTSGISIYTVKFSVGMPPFEVQAIFDTGSSITWIQCLPCIKCFSQQGRPIFDPSNSSSYRDLSCEDDYCKKLASVNRRCDKVCHYDMKYADDSYSKGKFAIETFTFETADGQYIPLINIAFGCGHDNRGTFEGHINGLFGLGPESVALINQVLQRKFSYCLLPPRDTRVSHLQFGTNALLGEKTISIFEGKGGHFYYIKLHDISIGSELLHIPTKAFEPTLYSGLILDTGTNYDILHTSVLDLVLQALRRTIKLKEIHPPTSDVELCYKGTVNDRVKLPSLTYHFIGGAELLVDPTILFEEVADGVLCLGTLRSKGMSVIGDRSQQNHIVGYDLVRKVITISPDDECKFFLFG